MTCAPDKTVGLYRRAMDHRPYRKTPLPGAIIIRHQLSITPQGFFAGTAGFFLISGILRHRFLKAQTKL